LLAPPTPAFRARGIGGRFNGEDPTVACSIFDQKFNAGVEVQYIGRNQSTLAYRLDALRRFGDAPPVGHCGGRYRGRRQA
jgi:hypothetical protein